MNLFVLRRLFAAFLVLPCAGCHSLITNGIGIQTGTPKLYSGLRSAGKHFNDDLRPPASGQKLLDGTLTAIDAPFSAALDTLLLPVVIPWDGHAARLSKESPATRNAETIARDQEMYRLQQVQLESAMRTGEVRPLIDGVPQLPSESAAILPERAPDLQPQVVHD